MKAEKTENIILTGAFALMLAVFTGATWLMPTYSPDANHDAAKLNESAAKAMHDVTAIESVLRNLEAFSKTHILGRSNMLAARGLLNYKVFAYSGKPMIVVGHHGWIFYVPREELPNNVKGGFQYTSIQPGPLTENELYSWNLTLENRRKWLAQRGIKYLVVIAPDKETIYPEYYPEAYAEAKTMNYIGQLKDYCQKHSKTEVLDLREPLKAGKSCAQIYYRRDSHWTKPGAFLAYTAIIHHLQKDFPSLHALPLSAYILEPCYRRQLDVGGHVGLSNIISDNTVNLIYKDPLPLRMAPLESDLRCYQSAAEIEHSTSSEIKGRRDLRVLIFSDSFGRWLRPFFSRTFGRVAVEWSYRFSTKLLEQEKPDIVIQEIAERNLKCAKPFNPPNFEEQLSEH